MIWTFKLTGGSEFALKIPGNPAVSHGGRLSLWHLRLSDDRAAAVEEFAIRHGATVERHALGETDEQTAMHQRFFEADDSVFPCVECLKCYWLDVQTEGYCGFEAWPAPRREAAYAAFETAREGAAACPLRDADDHVWVELRSGTGTSTNP